MTAEDRLVELEIRLAYQDQQIAQLDEVVREFAARVMKLEKRLAETAGGDEKERTLQPDEKPPHY